MRWRMASACSQHCENACRWWKRTSSRSGRRWVRMRGRARWWSACSPRRPPEGFRLARDPWRAGDMLPAMPPFALSALLLLAAYLIGSVSGSLVLGRFRNIDIREHGSGNAGGTNALRTLGWKFALGVAVIDVAKGALATWLVLHYAPVGTALSVTAHGYVAAALAVLGHVWPLWHGFRGGKGAATGVGGLLVLWPWIVPVLLLAWILVLVTTGYVGLSTVVAALCLPLMAWLFDAGPERMWFAIVTGLFLAWTHRANLVRLWHGNESRFERARLLYRLYGRSRF